MTNNYFLFLVLKALLVNAFNTKNKQQLLANLTLLVLYFCKDLCHTVHSYFSFPLDFNLLFKDRMQKKLLNFMDRFAVMPSIYTVLIYRKRFSYISLQSRKKITLTKIHDTKKRLGIIFDMSEQTFVR